MVESTTKPRVFVIIVAAGSGSRFGADVPKQFVDLAGRPVLMHTIDAFRRAMSDAEILLMLSSDGKEFWQTLCESRGYESPRVATGGNSRTETVMKALNELRRRSIADSDVVMIHDGARPLVSALMLNLLYEAVALEGNNAVVPAYAPTDSLEKIDASGVPIPVDRSNYLCVQTPQTFRASTIYSAYAALADAGVKGISDDVSVAHTYGGASIHAVPGDRNNIKITYSADISLAEVLMAHPYPYEP